MRLIVISNRLPFTLESNNETYEFGSSAGGLSSGLNTYLELLKKTKKDASYMSSLWIGWPGATIPEKDHSLVSKKALTEKSALPIFLDDEIVKGFYNGFSNKTLWPLFHYFTEYVTLEEENWQSYKKANEIFRDRILEVLKPGDILFIQDFHLMLLPRLLREARPDIPIGFFLHTPFPSYEIFRLLPNAWRTELLEGVLGADLIGFQTYDYSQYFLQSVTRILGYEHTLGKINLPSRIAQVGTFPIGIDYKKFESAATSEPVMIQKQRLKKVLNSPHVILSMDRLDYTKGIINRLNAFELLLEQHPQWHKKVVLVMIVVPSRIEVNTYQQMKRDIDEIIGRINGKFGDAFWSPIIYQYKTLDFDEMVAHYSLSDIALVTPLRDGMNLIAKEYLASKGNTGGVLVLSEMAGASKELGEAIIVNPYAPGEISQGIVKALEMPLDEQVKHNSLMQKRLANHTISSWANEFLHDLKAVKEEEGRIKIKLLRLGMKQKIVHDYLRAKKRLLLLDYDGILMPLAKHPDLSRPSVELLQILNRLSADPANEIAIISGRSKEILENWLGKIPVSFAAEHGVYIHDSNTKGWKRARSLSNTWKSQARLILDTYVRRLPRSFVEEKKYSLVFHYRNADTELGSLFAKELIDTLEQMTVNMDLQVLPGKKIVEIKHASVNKGTATSYFLAHSPYEFVLAIGDDITDEDIFSALPADAYSIRVGMTHSSARFNVLSIKSITELLSELSLQENFAEKLKELL